MPGEAQLEHNDPSHASTTLRVDADSTTLTTIHNLAQDMQVQHQALRTTNNALAIQLEERTAALAQANALLQEQIHERQRAEEELRMLNAIMEAVHKTLSLKEVYSIALDAVLGTTAFDIVMVYLVDENTNEAVLQAHVLSRLKCNRKGGGCAI